MVQAFRRDPETGKWVEYDPEDKQRERAYEAESSVPRSVRRRELEEYTATIDQLADTASESLTTTLTADLQNFSMDMTDAEWNELREALIEDLYQTRLYWSDAAGLAACDFYDKIITNRRETGLFNAAQLPEQVSRKRCADSVRALAHFIFAGRIEKFIKEVVENAHNGVRLFANQTILLNARRDRTKGVRYARVPVGAETCAFCIMLASRGFVYHTEKTAGADEHMHVHCDCKIVPGFEGDVIEGYDSRVYKNIYDAAAEQAERNANVNNILNYMRREILYPVHRDHINETKRNWWSRNKDEQNAKRRDRAAERRKNEASRKD